MHKTIALLLFFNVLIGQDVSAKKYISKTGNIYFISKTEAIDIDANNYQVAAIYNSESNDIVVIALIKSFEFELATADTHFNNTYMESDKFPKAVFKGSVEGLNPTMMKKGEEYELTVVGKLTIHGITKKVSVLGKASLSREGINISTKFSVSIDDYNITVPKVVAGRIAKEIDVTYKATMKLKE